jgi:hypothetical protein
VGRQKERGDKGDLDVEDNIKIHLKEIGWDVMDWIDMAEDRGQ